MGKIETRIFDELKKALVSFGDKYFIGDELNRSKVSDDLRAYDEALLAKLFEIDFIKKNYIKEVAGQKLFQIDQLEEAILYDDYWDTSYTKYENRVGLTSNGKFIEDDQDVVLDFPFKDGVLTASMTKEDNENGYDDAFLNEVIEKDEIDRLFDKKILKNAKRYDSNGENDTDFFDVQKDNLIIKGNNLLALHTLRDKYVGRIKMIYIDPPYNTGSDSFAYNDKFNHSAWLTFMRNRLVIAKELLSEDGIIAVQTDYHENSYLRVMMDELFGQDKFVSEISVKMSTASGPKMANIDSNIPKLKDSIIVYKKKSMVINKQPYKLKEAWDKEYSKILMNFTNEDRKILDKGIKEKDLGVTQKIIETCRLSTLSKEFPDKKNDSKWLHENAWRIVADKQNTGLDNLLAKSIKFWNGDVSAVKAKQGGITLFRTDKEFGKDTRVEIVFADNNLTEHV